MRPKIIIRGFCIILCCSMWLLVACKNKTQSVTDNQINIILGESISEYQKSGDTAILNRCYEQLNNNSAFVINDINSMNKQSIITLLNILKEYEKLDKILKNNKNQFEINMREELINMNDYLMYYENDYPKAVNAINKNISKYQLNLKQDPNDSISEMQLLVYDAILNGRDLVLQKIDSIQKNNPKYTYGFYEEVKEFINNTFMYVPTTRFTSNSTSTLAIPPLNNESEESLNFPIPEQETVPVKVSGEKKE